MTISSEILIRVDFYFCQWYELEIKFDVSPDS